jgi:hypothetical protein
MEINKLVSAERLRHQFDPPPSIRTIRDWQAKRAIPYFRLGRRIFFDPESVREYIIRHNQIKPRV